MNYGGKNPNGSTTGRPDGSPIGPHALSSISGVPTSPFPQTDLAVTYTDFKKISTLDEGTKHYELTYGVDDQRRMSVYKESGVTKLTRYYLGNYEEEVLANGNIRKIHYLSGAIFIDNSNANDSLYYSYADAQGSLIALTDADGNVVRRYAYDPWGKRRDANNWNIADNCVNLIVNRGYTEHEHVDAFGIINMNGRVYDPATASFFSADPVLTDAGNWLDYNRYGYCLGNPFRYTDPSGYNWWDENWKPIVTTATSIVATVAVSALTLGTATAPTASMLITAGLAGGAAGGFVGGALGTAFYGGSVGDVLLAGLKGAAIGGISGAITAGIGSAFGPVGVGAAFNPLTELERAGAHALAQGVFSVVRGGNFWQGAAAGLVSSLGGSAFQAWCPPAIATSFVGVTAFSAVMGGAGAYLGGARSPEEILMGVVAGAMTGALNAGLHQYAEKLKAIAQAKAKQAELLSRLYVHFQIGGQSPLTINSSSLDFSNTSQKQLGLLGMKVGDIRAVNLFKMGPTNGMALAFGRVNMQYYGNNQFTIVTDESSHFDFNPLIDKTASFGRNAGNILGAAINYNLILTPVSPLVPLLFGGGFDIIIKGTFTIPRY